MLPNYPLRWPQYLPYPKPLHRIRGRVPNRQSVDWAQAQYAPNYLAPGSASYQPYRYPHYQALWGSNVYNKGGYGVATAFSHPQQKLLIPFIAGILVGIIVRGQ